MKTALITGGATGIGRAISKSLAKDGFNIIIHYNSSYDKAISLQKEIECTYNVKCMTIKCDLKNEEEINNMYSEIKNNFNKVDVLVNNAALEVNSDLCDKNFNTFEDVLKVNLIGPFYLSKLVGLDMYNNKYGKIINISSNNAIDKYDPTTLEYDASKAGLISLTHNLAKAFAPYVNVNAICPGWIKSDKVANLNNSLDGMLEKEESKTILKNRFGSVDEVAYLVSFLVSDKADYINSEVIRIDGGVM